MKSIYRFQRWLSEIALVSIGYWVRFYGFGSSELKDALGSIAYEMFCGLEFLQLWQPAFLQEIGATLRGRLVLETPSAGRIF